MIILAAEREGYLLHVQSQIYPSLGFRLGRANELLNRNNPDDVAEGKKILLAACRDTDRMLEILTALVELEARGRKDLE